MREHSIIKIRELLVEADASLRSLERKWRMEDTPRAFRRYLMALVPTIKTFVQIRSDGNPYPMKTLTISIRDRNVSRAPYEWQGHIFTGAEHFGYHHGNGSSSNIGRLIDRVTAFWYDTYD